MHTRVLFVGREGANSLREGGRGGGTHRHRAEYSTDAVADIQTPAAEYERNNVDVGLRKIINVEVLQKAV